MKALINSLYFKLAAIALLALLLLIPAATIEDLVHEREDRRYEAVQEVSAKWGHAQTITGPFLSVPYTRYTIKETGQKTQTHESRERLHILPETLIVNGELIPQIRKRGIFEVPVYTSDLVMSGEFILPDLSALDIPLEDIEFDKAELGLGLTDLRGIEEQVSLLWNSNQLLFSSGLANNDIRDAGLHAEVEMDTQESTRYDFSVNLKLRGSQHLYFTPMGKTTEVDIRSSWVSPSFNGAFLPNERSLNDTGFSAQWKVLDLNRNFPQWWTNKQHSVGSSSFGVDLFTPVDNYQKTYRSIHYAILFIGLTFMVFFFIEVTRKVRIHAIQYLLVGMALVVFYTLLLSTSEHIDYNAAFGISAGATIALIAFYVRAVLKSGALTLLVTGILAVLYSFIFVVIQLEDMALLIGSIGIFLILAITMFFSRKIDWSSVSIGQQTGSEP